MVSARIREEGVQGEVFKEAELMRLLWSRRAYDVTEEPRLTPRFLAWHLERKMAPFPKTGYRGRAALAVGGDKFSIIEFERSLGHVGGDPEQAVGCVCLEVFRSVLLREHH